MTWATRLLAMTAVLTAGSTVWAGSSEESSDVPVATQVDGNAEVTAASRVLGRYPAGRMPASTEVSNALDVLGEQGTPEELPLLESISRDEEPGLVLSATLAHDRIVDRERQVLRDTVASELPDPASLERWIGDHASSLARSDGTTLGHTEKRMVAYTALLIGTQEPAESRPQVGWVSTAHALEDAQQGRRALLHLARGAVQEEPGALQAIRQYGVDPERLILGMVSSPDPSLAPTAGPEAVSLLSREGSVNTVAVLVEQARTENAPTRIRALDALGEMLKSSRLPPGARALARRELQRATDDPRGLVRDAARMSLADIGIGDGISGTVVPLH